MAFTLVELMAVVGIIATLAAILLPALAKARERSRGVYCVNNTRQLTLAWQLYADDHEGMLPFNLVMSGSYRTNINWVNNVMTWDLSPDNTNLATITDTSFGPYVAGMTSIYHCPSDQAVSALQRAAGWTGRIRSYSMNGMVGNGGPSVLGGQNTNNTGYRQFFKIDQMPRPTDIFVFLDEHPDSIDDGYFINQDGPSSALTASSVAINLWNDLPASYHDRSGAFSFADGHAGLHRWVNPSTLVPPIPGLVNYLPQMSSSGGERADFEWVLEHMSIEN